MYLGLGCTLDTRKEALYNCDLLPGCYQQLVVWLQEEYKHEKGSVVEVDYYNATALMPLTDAQLIDRTLRHYLASCQPAYGPCRVIDSSVLRQAIHLPFLDTCFAQTVSLCASGSFQILMPACLWALPCHRLKFPQVKHLICPSYIPTALRQAVCVGTDSGTVSHPMAHTLFSTLCMCCKCCCPDVLVFVYSAPTAKCLTACWMICCKVGLLLI